MYEHFINVYYVGSKKGRKCRKEGKKEGRTEGMKEGKEGFQKMPP